jgi:hypothetical protein
MLNRYVNMTPQQRMAQALQQQQQTLPMQQQQAPQQQSPFGDMAGMVQMYMRNKQMQGAAQQPMGGIFDTANAQAPNVTANNYTG